MAEAIKSQKSEEKQTVIPGTIEISHRVAWLIPNTDPMHCSQERVQSMTIRTSGVMECTTADDSAVTCPSGTRIISNGRNSICTDYNSGVEWSSEVYSFTVPQSFPVGGTDAFYLGYSGCCWASNVAVEPYKFGLMTSMILAPRTDNGEINSPPVTTMFPTVRVERGCTVDLRIPIVDEDGDFVKCREATDSDSLRDSCFSLCNAEVPNVVFNPNDAEGPCTLRISAIGPVDEYMVALVVEDSYVEGGDPLSSVPLQFGLEFYGEGNGNCLDSPTFVSNTPAFGSTVTAQGDGTGIDVVVRSSAADQSITDIVTLSPLHTEKTELTVVDGSGGRESSITVTFRPEADQAEGSHIACFYGVQSNGVSTNVLCITVIFESGDLDPCQSSPCENDGTCTATNENTAYECECPDGFLGSNCQNADPCQSSPCDNGGTCNALGENTSYQCDCPDGFLGDNCQNVDPCQSSPCENDGTCTATNENTAYQCDCADGFAGDNCQNADPCQSSPCENDGTCTAFNENTEYQCDCADGFAGDNCQNGDPCQSSPCENDGTCSPLNENTEYQCDCPDGFDGDNCEIVLPPDPCTMPDICQNGGTCETLPGDFNYTCTCVAGFSGQNCDEEFECPEQASYRACLTECDMTSCLYPNGPPDCDNVMCSEGCLCDEGFLREFDQCVPTDNCGCGRDGEYYPLDTVLVNDTCTEECECVSPPTFECRSLDCSDDASCQPRDDGYACVCNEGFQGNGLVCTPGTLCDEREDCIGPDCQMGCFSSPNYPDGPYGPDLSNLYIVQASGATYYTVTCDRRFGIEEDRDALYVGPGDPPPVGELPYEPSHPIYLFDGDTAPERFLVNASALWMYFTTDRIVQRDGWRCCWKADDPCLNNPCQNDGRCEGNSDGSYICVCVGSWRGDHCEIDLAHCSAHGDPHYTSFDGVKYNFEGACKYYLVRYCGGDDTQYFDIIQQNRQVTSNARASRTEDLWIHIFGHEIGLLQNKEFTIDGLLTLPPVTYQGFEITFTGNKLVARFNNSLEVQWDGEYGVDVELSREFSSQTCGLCGNMDMDRDNEFRTPENEPVDSPAEFGNSWKYNTEECNRDDVTDDSHPCDVVPNDLVDEADEFFVILDDPEGPFAECHGVIPVDPLIEDVFYDWCAAHPDISGACADVANYASQCQARGIEIGRWRREDFCPLPCPENSEYRHCMTACPRLCGEDRPEDFECRLPCVEGCQCNEGHILDGDQRCVPEDQCGCFYEGNYHTARETFYSEDCTMQCTCDSGAPSCLAFPCHDDAFCGVVDGIHGCHCSEGFIGDGRMCADDPCLPNPCNGGRCVLDEGNADGFYCVCFRGSEGDRCEEARGHCYAHGDPHYRSFDGVTFNYQGGCKYILLQPCDVGSGPHFRVIQDNRKLRPNDRSPAVTETVYVEVNETVYALKQDKEVSINGVDARPPVFSPGVSIVRRGGKLVLETTFGLEVRWNGMYEVDVSLSAEYFNNTCGLCSNWNGDPNDEFGDFDNPEEFGNSWAVEDDDCESNEEPTPFVCNSDPTVILLVQDVCSIVYSGPFRSCESLDIADTFYEDCVFDLCATYHERPNLCPSLTNYADLCRESGFPAGLWRSPYLCPFECPRWSHYSPCVSACQPTCTQAVNGPCPILCVEGCECDEGYVLSGEECVHPDQCGCQGEVSYYEPGESYVNFECTQVCTCNGPDDLTCEDIPCHANATCEAQGGVHGCYCDEGFYGDGYECEPDPCSSGEERCSSNGECISGGDGTFHCECRRGWSGDYCDMGMAICSGYGDPHYTSFDRRRFDYQGKCRYFLLESSTEDSDVPFSVVAQHVPAPFNMRVALTNELHVTIGDVQIELLQGGDIQVNDIDVRTPVDLRPWAGVSIRRAGKVVVLKTNFSVEIEWDGENTFSIAVSAAYFNRTAGLCGPYDEDPANDFTTRDGEVIDDVNTFGDSWLYGECGTSEPPGEPYNPCEENSENADLAEQLCNIIAADDGPLSDCHSVIEPLSYHESCLYDLCSTLPDRGALCDDIAKYADDCRGAGVDVGVWRSGDFCPFNCPEGSSYSPCASGCPVTCDDVRDNSTDVTVCTQSCREGCQCQEGRVLSDDRCVPPDQCGCNYNGNYYLQEETFLVDNCQWSCTCEANGEVTCEAFECNRNAECVIGEGELRCRCREPLVGNGIECNLDPCLDNPCQNFGICRNVGDDDYVCECTELWGGEHCTIRQGVCLIFGSLHFNTFDGVEYSFEGECKYILSQTCQPDFEPSFEIIQENMRRTTLSSAIRALHVRIDDQMITLGRGRTCYVNRKERSLPVSLESIGVEVRISGMNVVLSTNFGLTVSYDGWFGASVIVGPEFAEQVCGLCGNFDGNSTNDDDIQQGDDVIQGSGTDVGNFYRYDGNGDCAVPVEPPFLETGHPCERVSPQVYGEAMSFCQGLQEGALEPCSTILNVEAFSPSCLYDACESRLLTDLICLHPMNFARQCRRYGGQFEPWRRVDYCPINCPPGSHYSAEVSACPATCVEFRRGETPSCEGQRAVEGCECDEGFYLSGTRCVAEEECGCLQGGMYYEQGQAFVNEDCSMLCSCQSGQVSCSEFGCSENATCEISNGQRMCRCNSGYAGNGVQCEATSCLNVTCENGGRCMPGPGEAYSCVCGIGFGGDHCEFEILECQSYGDPHYTTFKLDSYNLQEECQFYLARSCEGEEPFFEVIQDNEKMFNKPQGAMIRELWVHIYDLEIGLHRDRRVTVDGMVVTPPYSSRGVGIRITSDRVVVSTNFTLEIFWDGFHQAVIRLSTEWRNRTCGLCGDMGGPLDQELRAQIENGDVTAFGNLNKVNLTECPSPAEPDPPADCSDRAAEIVYPACTMLIDDRGPFRRCPQSFNEIAADACIFDGCGGFPSVIPICTALSLATKLCQRMEAEVDPWRRADFCPMSCPENSEYRICASSCQRRCGEEPLPLNFECPVLCEEGCQCGDGYVLDSDDRCKRPNECGCFEGDVYYLSGQEFYRPACQEVCQCLEGSLTCEAVECHDNATCGVREGIFGCHCNQGFLGDGRDCVDDPCQSNPCENGGVCTPSEDGSSFECRCVGRWTGQYCNTGARSCSVSGHTNYDRFDGTTFEFYGNCTYILAQSCTEGDNSFRVILENEADEEFPQLPRTKAVHISVAGKDITLRPEMTFEINGAEMNYPLLLPGLAIEQRRWFLAFGLGEEYMRVTSDTGLTVIWDGKAIVDVALSADYEGSTCGICGDINNLDEGFGEYENASQLAAAWVHNSEECDSPVESYEPCEETSCNLEDAVAKCSILLSPQVACPSGWRTVPSGAGVYICYYVREVEEGLTFAAARQECQSIGGELLDLVTDDEASSFRDLTEGEVSGSYWLDCSDREQEGHWLCRSDVHFWFNFTERGYWPWAADQPDNGGEGGREENCLLADDFASWRDVPCDALVTHLVCQLASPRQPLTPFTACRDLVSPQPHFAACISSLCATLPNDDRLCSHILGYEDQCRLFGAEIGAWRSPNLCPILCTEGSVFRDCVSPCPPTCEDPDRTCAAPCVIGCQCLDGWIRQGLRCVPRDQCGCFEESLGQQFQVGGTFFTVNCTAECTCTPGGQTECVDVNCADNAQCVSGDGDVGYRCQCAEGYYFAETECQAEPCTEVDCANGGICINLDDGMYSCHCQEGWTGEHCEDEEAWCTAHGALHYVTFDDRRYDFYGDCVYYLARHCGEDVENPLFMILQKNERHALQRAVSATLWVEVHLQDVVIRLKRHKVVLVNEIERNLPVTNYMGVNVWLVGNRVVLSTDFGLFVYWDGYGNVDIRLPGEFKNQTCGLCGSYDGDPWNDFVDRDGNVTESPAEFGNSWAYNDGDCEPDDGSFSGQDLGSVCGEERLQRAQEFCSTLFQPFEAACSADYLDSYSQNCVYDVCTVGDYHYGCLYASHAFERCRILGGRPEPRGMLPEACTVKCQANSVFSFCMSRCPRTCDDVMEIPRQCSDRPCVEGCECNEGFILSGLKCVPEEECGCRDNEQDGAYYLSGEEFTREDCREQCECEEGEISCEPLDCHCDAVCSADADGKYGCHCPHPYVGDGLICTVDPCYSNPCQNDGKCAVLRNHSYICVCQPEWTGRNCEIERAVCRVYGSPQHFTTFDGANYDFFGTCQYTLLADCAENSTFSSFRVVIQNEPLEGRSALTKVQDVFVYHLDFLLGLHQGKRITLNGVPVTAPFEVDGFVIMTGTHVFVTSPFNLTIRWDGYSSVDLWLDESILSDKEPCGLCGNVDDNPDNILTETADGEMVSNSVDFGNSWIFNPDECDDPGDDDVQNACNGDIALAAAREECAIITDEEGPFAACTGEVDADLFFENCVFAVCASDDPEDELALCRSLQIYETHCLDQCLEVGPWRTPHFCAPRCPGHAQFSPSTVPCIETCQEALNGTRRPCPFPNQAGCDCLPGYYLSGDECVPIEQCGCFHNFRYWKPYEVFVSYECESVCTCYPGNRVECEEKECHNQATCLARGGVYDCHCNDGFEDDGCGGCRPNPCTPYPCENGGKCIIVEDDEYFCQCPPEFAGRNCEAAVSRCSVSGSLHYETFDGNRFVFLGECEYTLVRSCFGEGPQFNVTQVTQSSESDPVITSTNKIRISSATEESYELELRQGRLLLIDGERHIPPVIRPWLAIHYSGSWLVLRDHIIGLTVRWDGDKHVELYLGGYANQVCGLCGNFDGDSTNDFVTPTGEMAPSAVEFGNSWKVNDSCEDAVEVPSPCGGDAGMEAMADIACNIIRDTVGLFGACHSVVPYEPFYDKCVYDICQSLPNTLARCQHIRDYAERCINEGVEISPEWREDRNCLLECPDFSSYSCINSCPPSCLGNILYQDPRRCWQYCNDGCVCNEGYILNDDQCVREEDCSCLYEGRSVIPFNYVLLNEDCTSRCQCGADGQVTCEDVPCHSDAECLNVDGLYQCVCSGSLVGDGFQCSVTPCVSDPCRNGGTCYEDGTDGYYCVCTLGWLGPDCAQGALYCMTYGDPHYRTFDGEHYDFMGDCTYLLAGDCGVSPLVTVIQHNERLEESSYTVMRELEIVLNDGLEVRLVPNRGVFVDDVLQSPPFITESSLTIRRAGNYIIILTDLFEIKWNGAHNADIRVPVDRFGIELCGLCGNANGDSGDDFNDGDPATDDTPVTFGNSQAVGDCDAAQEQPNPCGTAFESQLELADLLCRPLDGSDNSPFADCDVPPEPYYAACRYDICATPIPVESVACGVIATYARLCQELGFTISEWRTEFVCSQECLGNSVYSLCADPCPRTCRNPDLADEPCIHRCVEGCTCRDGFYQDGENCVRPDGCGCVYDGDKYVRFNENFFNESCSVRCTCTEAFGEVECEPVQCHDNAMCSEVDGLERCVCMDGFVGDGVECFFAECAGGPCAEGAECLRRLGGNPDYVCECPDNNVMGHDCDIEAVYNERYACYGADCNLTTFSSPGYPEPYPNTFNGFYQLWVPGASFIRVTFSSPFEVEDGRDFLYVGPGFQYPLGLNAGPLSTVPGVVYQLDGYTPPGPILIVGDAVWLYFQTDDLSALRGWEALLEAEFDALSGTPLCWDGSETRLPGTTWRYGKCDECQCADGAVITCSLNASQPIACDQNADCPGDSTCVSSNQIPLCMADPCDGMYCDVGTIYEDCDVNPKCATVTVTADLASVAPDATVIDLCNSLIQAVEMNSAKCATFECAVRLDESRKRRATTDNTLIFVIFLESGSPSGSAAPVTSQDGMTPVDSLALALFHALTRLVSDDSLPINITDVIYFGARPSTKAPLASTKAPLATTTEEVKKITVETSRPGMPTSTLIIISVGSAFFLILIAVMLAVWCRLGGRQSSKTTVTFNGNPVEAPTNEAFEMVDTGPAFSRAIPLDDGTGHQGNVYGVKYDLAF